MAKTEETIDDVVDGQIGQIAELYRRRQSEGIAKKTLFLGPYATLDENYDLAIIRSTETKRLYVRDDNGNRHEVFICNDGAEGKGEYLVMPIGALLRFDHLFFNPFPDGGIKLFTNPGDNRRVEGVVIELGKKYKYSGSDSDGDKLRVVESSKDRFRKQDYTSRHLDEREKKVFPLEKHKTPYLGGNTTNAARARGALIKSLGIEDHTHLMVGIEPSLVDEFTKIFSEQEKTYGYTTEIFPVQGYPPRKSTIIRPIIYDEKGNIERYLDRFVLNEKRKADLSPELAAAYRERIIEYVAKHGIDRIALSSMANCSMVTNLPPLLRRLRAERGENFQAFMLPSGTFQSTVSSIAGEDSSFSTESYYTSLLGLVDVLIFNKDEAEMLGNHLWTDKERKSLGADESSPQKLVRYLSNKTRGKKAIATFGDSGIWVCKRSKGDTPNTENLEVDYLIWGNHKVQTVYFTLGAGDSTYGAATVGFDLGLREGDLLSLCLLASQHKIEGTNLYQNVAGFPELREHERETYARGDVGQLRFSKTHQLPPSFDKDGQSTAYKMVEQATILNPAGLFIRIRKYLNA